MEFIYQICEVLEGNSQCAGQILKTLFPKDSHIISEYHWLCIYPKSFKITNAITIIQAGKTYLFCIIILAYIDIYNVLVCARLITISFFYDTVAYRGVNECLQLRRHRPTPISNLN